MYYCPHCLDEHMPTAEAKANKFRCTRCLECPVCATLLAFVPAAANSGNSAENGAEPAAQDTFALACGFCHWHSSTALGFTGSLSEIAAGSFSLLSLSI